MSVVSVAAKVTLSTFVPTPSTPAGGRLGLAFLGAPSVPEMVALAQRAEAAGFESVWVAETRITRDAVVPMTAIAGATERIRVGTAIMNVFTRGPVVLAITFLGLEEVAPGRIVMGLGTGSPLILAPQGQPFERPLTRLREYCRVLQPLMRGEEVTFDGETIRLEGARVEDLLSQGGAIASESKQVPLYLGVTGPRSLELAGRVADGVLLNVCLSTEYVERARSLIERGAAEAGRQLGDLELGMMIVTSPDVDSAKAKDRARRFIAVYVSMFPNIAGETGLPLEVLDALRAAVRDGGVDAGAALIDDSIVDALTVAGTPDECRARLDAYRQAGIELPVLVPLEDGIDAVIDSLGGSVV
jgi:5,10-methylenetetrahydromethanopterin reductase